MPDTRSARDFLPPRLTLPSLQLAAASCQGCDLCIHKKPSSRQIEACKPWLLAEISLVAPALIVCLGATSVQALLGKDFRITRQRGKFVEVEGLPSVMATYHPSAILRAPDRKDAARMRREFEKDTGKRDQEARQSVKYPQLRLFVVQRMEGHAAPAPSLLGQFALLSPEVVVRIRTKTLEETSMRTIRILLVGMCLVALSGCYYHRPWLAHRYGYGCCPAPCCPAPAPHCACYLGAPVSANEEPPVFVAPQPGR